MNGKNWQADCAVKAAFGRRSPNAPASEGGRYNGPS